MSNYHCAELSEREARELADLRRLPAGTRAFFTDYSGGSLRQLERTIETTLGMFHTVDVLTTYGYDAGIDGTVAICRVIYSAS